MSIIIFPGGGGTDTYPSLTVSPFGSSVNLLGAATLTTGNKIEYTSNLTDITGPERLVVTLDKGSGAYAMSGGCLIHIVLEKI